MCNMCVLAKIKKTDDYAGQKRTRDFGDKE